MAVLDLASKAGGGGTPLGGTVMAVRNETVFEDNGQTFLQCGYIDTDITGIDASIVNYSTYFSKEDRVNLPVNFTPTSNPYVIGANGTHILVLSTTCYRSTDGGLTWSSVITGVNSGSVSKRGLATNGSGVWVSLSDGAAYKSTDDGLTWSLAFNTQSSTTGYEVHYSEALGKFLVLEKGTGASTTDSRFITSSDGVTWDIYTSGFNNNNQQKLFMPESGNMLFISGMTTTNVFYIRRSLDGGATWAHFEYDNSTFLDTKPSAIWVMGDRLYATYDNEPSTNGFTIASFDVNDPATAGNYAPPLEVRIYSDVDGQTGELTPMPVHNYELDSVGEYVMPSGYKVLKDGFTIAPAWATKGNSKFTDAAYQLYTKPHGSWRELLIGDTTSVFPILTAVPCVGNSTSYIEGQARQFMRIK